VHWNQLKSLTSAALNVLPLPGAWSSFLADALPLQAVDGFNQLLLAKHPQQLQQQQQLPTAAQVGVSAESMPICPFTWSKAMHGINCEYAWPKEYTGNHGEALIELDTPAYVGRLSQDKVVERVLALGGIRLAHVLNFALGGEGGVYVDY
jgi:hypothetical protein